MANEDLIKQWVIDNLSKFGISLKKGNLVKESAEAVFPLLYNAMRHASKKQNGNRGTSDFSYVVKGKDTGKQYLILIETKDDSSNVINLNNHSLILDEKSTMEYAVNGAVWYAKQIQKETKDYPRIFAIGVAGNYDRQYVIPYYVNETGGFIALPRTTSFQEFTVESIDEYYRVNVEHQTPQSELKAEELAKIASDLHNDIRTYTSLKNSLKAPLIASILLAIHSKELTLDDLKGSTTSTNNDGVVIYRAVASYLEQRKRLEPDFDDSKIEPILSEFSFIKVNKALYMPKAILNNRSPLYEFTSILFDVYNTVKIGEDADILGDFYSEFVKYNDSDGNVLGIVLTPKHITSLMADLIEIGKDNYLLDPTTGSGSFLVAGMNRMIKQIPHDSDYKKKFNEVVSTHLYGVENEPSIYAVAASNMILRGDGKSNMTYGDFFKYTRNNKKNSSDSLVSKAPKIDRVLMNPPYSQGKKAPEYKFIKHALELMDNGGILAVIMPISVLVSGGKGVSAKELKEFKEWLLKDYVVKDIITMNPLTFYPTATQTVVAIIEKNKGIGQQQKKTKLINFTDDGYTLIPKKGLVPNGTNVRKRQQLINVVVNDYDAPNEFMIKVMLTADNEWLHNAHYTNPDRPTDGDFMQSVEDFVAFKQNMILHGRGDLFGND
ncbi:HsdM family class I SAM-dependent methyltransferase [Limosilactobacillus reuteri]|uniref:HsdM family class I SAM-dependent methyltransferase n=1 Tax=Limosilactobacillus reuteri TaxID=1598 RepID=UPI0021D36CB2|nr:SAM-dependent methyltransferase [Limosilactobacillus reuteri]MCU4692834.1 SAM-dependent methyltransferase [Limosilactobacillus reuteri]